MPTTIKDKVKKIIADTIFDINAVVFCLTIGIAVFLTIASVAIAKYQIVMFDVDQTQMSTLFTTTAQIVGGLYGLTLTAYVFFVDKFRDSQRMMKRYMMQQIRFCQICSQGGYQFYVD